MIRFQPGEFCSCPGVAIFFNMHIIYIFFLGWMLSFFGQLPLGTMSFTSTQIAVQENFRKAWQFSIGVALVEIIYLRLVLAGVSWIMEHSLLFKTLGWITVAFFLGLGILTLISARKNKEDKKTPLLNNHLNRFFLGLSMSALNPAQIPFWFIWTNLFLQEHLIVANSTTFNIFSVGAGLGTVSGLVLYMYGGKWLINRMKTSHRTLNYFMAVIFLIAAFAQLYRMLR
jgi:threonine/homoserine/homoserine lactone efflux protein